MQYNKKALKALAIKLATDEELHFMSDVIAYLPPSRSTFYAHFPPESEDLNEIHDLLYENRIKDKAKIRKKLLASSKASELISLYKLIGDSEDRQKLNQSHVDHTSKGEKISTMDLSQLSFEEIEELLEKAEKQDSKTKKK